MHHASNRYYEGGLMARRRADGYTKVLLTPVTDKSILTVESFIPFGALMIGADCNRVQE